MGSNKRPKWEKISRLCYHLAEISELAAVLLAYYLECCQLRLTLRKLCFPSVSFRLYPKEIRFPCFGLGPSLGTAPTSSFLGDFSHEIFMWMNAFVSENADHKHNHFPYLCATSEDSHYGYPFPWGEDFVWIIYSTVNGSRYVLAFMRSDSKVSSPQILPERVQEFTA